MPRLYNRSITVNLRPEAKLLLCCARTQMDAVGAKRIGEVLQEGLDWDYLHGLALQHGMLPLLYSHLKAICSEAIPKGALALLQDSFYATARYNLFLVGELLNLLRLFEAHNIPAVPFKGPALAMLVYGNLALRDFCDLDVLVRKQDVLKAKTLLISHGYSPLRQFTKAQEAVHLQSFHAYAFVRDAGRINLDLHWRFAPSHYFFPLDLECLWERLEHVSLSGRTILNLPQEDLLLILCMHGAKDGWARLIWICDIAELIRTYPRIDWKQVMEQARMLSSERQLFLGLLLASELLGATLPKDVLQRVQANSAVQSLTAQVRGQLFCEADAVTKIIARMALHLKVMDHLQGKVPYFLYCLRQVITPNIEDRVFLALPARLSCFYYLIRPIRLVRTYGLWLWNRNTARV